MKSAKQQSIQLKIEKAKSLLAEIDVLLLHAFHSTAINRIYYACFHATKAILLTKDLIPKQLFQKKLLNNFLSLQKNM